MPGGVALPGGKNLAASTWRQELGGKNLVEGQEGMNELTGFSFMLVADDYAMSPAVSGGILEALAAGRLSGTGAMTNRPFWPQGARELLAADAGSKAGLHLNLTCGEPLTKMPGLAASGKLPRLRTLQTGGWRRNLPRGELAAEIRAQLDAFVQAIGAPPVFIDGHQHVQMLPQIREILFEELSRRSWQGKVWLRDGADQPSAMVRRRIELIKAAGVSVLGCGFGRAARAAGFATNAGFSGFSAFDPDRDYAADFARYLVAPGSRHLVMCHPGHIDDELRAVDPNTQSRENELVFLLSRRFQDVLSRSHAKLATI